MDTILERLELLDAKVREALADAARVRGQREALAAQVQTLEGELAAREEHLAALRAAQERDQAELARLRAERDEVRGRVESLLGEIGRLEVAVQNLGAAG